jgi:hypothetical protein
MLRWIKRWRRVKCAAPALQLALGIPNPSQAARLPKITGQIHRFRRRSHARPVN